MTNNPDNIDSLGRVPVLVLNGFLGSGKTTLALAIMSMPLASYIGIVSAESGVVNLKDIRPYLMRVIPSARRRLAALPATRKALQADLTRFIREMGPKLGDIYYDKNVDWKEIQAASRRSSLSPETKKYS